MGRPIRQALGTLGLRRLPLPITSQMGGDKAAGGRSCSPRPWPIDTRLRDGLAFAKEPYLHSLRMPLAEAVALDEAQLVAGGQAGTGSETNAKGTAESEGTVFA